MGTKILLVEGDVDDYFFKQLVKTDDVLSNLDIEIQPKGGVAREIKTLEEMELFDDFKDGNLTHLGIIADADHNGIDTGGFDNRWNKFSTILKNEGFTSQKPTNKLIGSLFEHQERYNPVGLWLMPNHCDDGALEDLVLATRIKIDEQPAIFSHVESSIDKLGGNKLFAEHHDSKAKVFTWLAWQKKPRHFIAEVIDSKKPQKNLINIESPEIQGLVNWLKQVFTES